MRTSLRAAASRARCSCALSKATPEKQGLLAVIPPDEIHGLFVKGTSASVIWESLFFKTDRGGVLIISIYDS